MIIIPSKHRFLARFRHVCAGQAAARRRNGIKYFIMSFCKNLCSWYVKYPDNCKDASGMTIREINNYSLRRREKYFIYFATL